MAMKTLLVGSYHWANTNWVPVTPLRLTFSVEFACAYAITTPEAV